MFTYLDGVGFPATLKVWDMECLAILTRCDGSTYNFDGRFGFYPLGSGLPTTLMGLGSYHCGFGSYLWTFLYECWVLLLL